MHSGKPCTQMQIKHQSAGSAGGEGDLVGLDRGVGSLMGDMQSMRGTGGSDSQSISLIRLGDEGSRMLKGFSAGENSSEM